MIDYLISDQIRKIWINLELYFESYKFSSFYGFFRIIFQLFLIFYEFIWIYFELKIITKIKLKSR